jgi:hypothetical protein
MKIDKELIVGHDGLSRMMIFSAIANDSPGALACGVTPFKLVL